MVSVEHPHLSYLFSFYFVGSNLCTFWSQLFINNHVHIGRFSAIGRQSLVDYPLLGVQFNGLRSLGASQRLDAQFNGHRSSGAQINGRRSLGASQLLGAGRVIGHQSFIKIQNKKQPIFWFEIKTNDLSHCGHFS